MSRGYPIASMAARAPDIFAASRPSCSNFSKSFNRKKRISVVRMRNAYLNPNERRAATVLYRALDGARRSIERGERDALRLVAAMREVIRAEPLVETEYVELVDAENLEPMTLLRGECLALLAARIGATRLIDNLLIEERDGGFRTTL
jgi:pantothenate synthetase